MLEIERFREDPQAVKENLKKRKDPRLLKLVDFVVKKDKEYRVLLQEAQNLRTQRNKITKEIDQLRVQKKSFQEKIKEAKKIPPQLKIVESNQEKINEELKHALMKIPNILHESVPVGNDEHDNQPIKTIGKKTKFKFEPVHHGELATKLNLADFERAVKISGTGFYFLKNELALMEMALARLGVDLLLKKKFQLIQPPLIMRRNPYEGVTDLTDFENVMYKIDAEDEYLIATSEHPIVAMHMDELIQEHDLPIKYVGISPCFRREIGKHGLDERGLFRVHQFNKVEQVVFCMPEDSWKIHEELLINSETLMKKLELPYQVVNVCTGDMGIVASKKYDIEGYSPREDKYIELMSCSNCLTYQSNRLKIRYKTNKGEKGHVHTLNNTMVATARMLRIIIENYQKSDGSLKVPKVLVPYMNGIKEIVSQDKPK